MNQNLQYFAYIIRHKVAVFRAGRYFSAPLFRLLIHDWTKFLPSEWLPYARYFYGLKSIDNEERFEQAWNRHQKRNKHHWQYWASLQDVDDPPIYCLKIPDKYIREMVADWTGAGMACSRTKNLKTGVINARAWYAANRDRLMLHEDSRKEIERLLEFKLENI